MLLLALLLAPAPFPNPLSGQRGVLVEGVFYSVVFKADGNYAATYPPSGMRYRGHYHYEGRQLVFLEYGLRWRATLLPKRR